MTDKPQLTIEQRLRMAGFFTAIMLFMGVGSFNGLTEDKHRAGFVDVQGTVISMHQRTGLKRVSTFTAAPQLLTDVDYKFEQNGQAFNKTETLEHISDLEAKEQFQPAKAIAVHVNPNDPSDATIESAPSVATCQMIVIGLGLAFLGGLVQCLRLYLQMRNRKVNENT